MPWFLPPHLLTLFEPREPVRYLEPLDKPAHEKEASGYSGIASFVSEFEDPKDTPPPTRIETREEKENKKRQEKEEQVSYKLEQDLALWTPRDNPAATSDPYKTLFVGRLNYDTSESKLRREFEEYGPIRNIIMVHDKFTGRSRGYAFIEYERERDMRSAYKYADGKKIDGRRVVVDIERGRTIEGWKPRRLGGGLGGRREQDPDTGRDETSYEARNRENDRGERSERQRHRSRSRDRRRRSRDRRTERYVRDRSRDRRRGRDLGSNDTESRKRRRSNSTESDRKRRRSRSNNRREYDHGDKDSRRRNRCDTDEGTWYERKTMTKVDNQGGYNNNSTDCGEGSNNYGGPYKGYGAY